MEDIDRLFDDFKDLDPCIVKEVWLSSGKDLDAAITQLNTLAGRKLPGSSDVASRPLGWTILVKSFQEVTGSGCGEAEEVLGENQWKMQKSIEAYFARPQTQLSAHSDLSADERSMVEFFVSATGTSEGKAVETLREFGWRLEEGINGFLDPESAGTGVASRHVLSDEQSRMAKKLSAVTGMHLEEARERHQSRSGSGTPRRQQSRNPSPSSPPGTPSTRAIPSESPEKGEKSSPKKSVYLGEKQAEMDFEFEAAETKTVDDAMHNTRQRAVNDSSESDDDGDDEDAVCVEKLVETFGGLGMGGDTVAEIWKQCNKMHKGDRDGAMAEAVGILSEMMMDTRADSGVDVAADYEMYKMVGLDLRRVRIESIGVFLTQGSMESLRESAPPLSDMEEVMNELLDGKDGFLPLQIPISRSPSKVEDFLCPFGEKFYIQVVGWGQEEDNGLFWEVECEGLEVLFRGGRQRVFIKDFGGAEVEPDSDAKVYAFDPLWLQGRIGYKLSDSHVAYDWPPEGYICEGDVFDIDSKGTKMLDDTISFEDDSDATTANEDEDDDEEVLEQRYPGITVISQKIFPDSVGVDGTPLVAVEASQSGPEDRYAGSVIQQGGDTGEEGQQQRMEEGAVVDSNLATALGSSESTSGSTTLSRSEPNLGSMLETDFPTALSHSETHDGAMLDGSDMKGNSLDAHVLGYGSSGQDGGIVAAGGHVASNDGDVSSTRGHVSSHGGEVESNDSHVTASGGHVASSGDRVSCDGEGEGTDASVVGDRDGREESDVMTFMPWLQNDAVREDLGHTPAQAHVHEQPDERCADVAEASDAGVGERGFGDGRLESCAKAENDMESSSAGAHIEGLKDFIAPWLMDEVGEEHKEVVDVWGDEKFGEGVAGSENVGGGDADADFLEAVEMSKREQERERMLREEEGLEEVQMMLAMEESIRAEEESKRNQADEEFARKLEEARDSISSDKEVLMAGDEDNLKLIQADEIFARALEQARDSIGSEGRAFVDDDEAYARYLDQQQTPVKAGANAVDDEAFARALAEAEAEEARPQEAGSFRGDVRGLKDSVKLAEGDEASTRALQWGDAGYVDGKAGAAATESGHKKKKKSSGGGKRAGAECGSVIGFLCNMFEMYDRTIVEEVLRECGGDVCDAIEFLTPLNFESMHGAAVLDEFDAALGRTPKKRAQNSRGEVLCLGNLQAGSYVDGGRRVAAVKPSEWEKGGGNVLFQAQQVEIEDLHLKFDAFVGPEVVEQVIQGSSSLEAARQSLYSLADSEHDKPAAAAAGSSSVRLLQVVGAGANVRSSSPGAAARNYHVPLPVIRRNNEPQRHSIREVQCRAMTADEVRRDAEKYHQQMRNYMMLANQSRKAGDFEDAYLKTKQAKNFRALYEECMTQAEQMFRSEKNPMGLASRTLDLHGFYVKEAMQLVEEYLKLHKQKAQGEKGYHVEVITGRGNHSVGGIARIKPAVEEYLKENGYKYWILRDGCFKIMLGRRDW